METEIVFAGFGGQGVLTAGMIVAEIALSQGCEVTWMPAYGAEMRGGKAYSVVKFSDEMIASPDVEKIDVLIALSRQALDFAASVKDNGILIANENIIPNDITFRDDIKVIKINCDNIANNLNNPKAVNIIAIGAMIEKSKIFTEEITIKEITKYFEDKGKSKHTQSNIDAFWAGYRAAESAEKR